MMLDLLARVSAELDARGVADVESRIGRLPADAAALWRRIVAPEG
jgi:hypothetical protein